MVSTSPESETESSEMQLIEDVKLTPDEMIESVWFKIVNEPENWDQGRWRVLPGVENSVGNIQPACGTAYCVGGWVAHLDGGVFLSDNKHSSVSHILVPVKDDYGTDVMVFWGEHGHVVGVNVHDRAKRLLDLDREEAEFLFAFNRTKDQIKEFFETKLGRPLSGRNPWLLRSTLAQIEAHPEDWDQGEWWKPAEPDKHFCGGVGCYAGHAALIDSGPPLKYQNGAHTYFYAPRKGERGEQETGAPLENGQTTGIKLWARAANALGLTTAEADFMFEGYHTLTALRAMVNNLCAGRDIKHGHTVDDYGRRIWAAET